MQVPLDELPEIGDPVGRDEAELIWAPLDDDDDEEEAGEEADEDRAAFLRKWASLDYEHESLMSLSRGERRGACRGGDGDTGG